MQFLVDTSCPKVVDWLLVHHELEMDTADSVVTIMDDVVRPCLAFDINQNSSCKRESILIFSCDIENLI